MKGKNLFLLTEEQGKETSQQLPISGGPVYNAGREENEKGERKKK